MSCQSLHAASFLRTRHVDVARVRSRTDEAAFCDTVTKQNLIAQALLHAINTTASTRCRALD